MSNNPKRHHHLAQAIQRNFLEKDQDKLWWYSREKDAYEERTPYGIAHGRHTYTLQAAQGEARYALERAFSRVEDKASPVLRKLAQSEEISQEERNSVAELVGFQYLRTPSKIALIQKLRDISGQHFLEDFVRHLGRMTPEEFTAYVRGYESKSGSAMSLSQAELVESLTKRPPKIVSTKEATLDSLVELGTDIAVEYSKRSWIIMHAPADSSFITSSEGIFSSGQKSERGTSPGPGVPGVVTVFPFARHTALLIEGAGPSTVRHAQIHKQNVRDINDQLALVSGEIYGSPRRLIESIVERNQLAGTRYELVPDHEYLKGHLAELLRKNTDAPFSPYSPQ